MIYFIALLVMVAGVYFYKHRPVHDITIPTPDVLRTDLMYGYYGCIDDQVTRTAGHTNLLWESQFQGEDKAIQNILEARTPVVLDLANQLYVKFAPNGRNYRYNADGEQNLRALFSKMQAAGALQYIRYLYVMDEPNTNVVDAVNLKMGINTSRKVSAEFGLTDVKLACIYAAEPAVYDCKDEFDLVGVDDYESKSQIFVNGTYDRLKAGLRSDQKTMVIPGGAFGQDPTPFVNFAHSNQEVALVLAFVWFNGLQPADKWIGIGDEKNPLKSRYIEVGRALTGKSA